MRRLGERAGRLRERVRSTPFGRFAWRLVVGVVGTTALVLGAIMIPGPGQGWAVVFLGLAILSTEFSWAERLRRALWHRLVAARSWYARRGRGTQGVVAAATFACVAVVVAGSIWLSLAVTGVPSWVPSPLSQALGTVPGVRQV